MRQALRFIRENIARPFGAAEIAASLGVPRIRLDRLFASELKRSAGAEILRQRIAKAKRLLTGTNISVKDAGQAVGYADANYFAKVFKRVTGQSPTDCRLGNMH